MHSIHQLILRLIVIGILLPAAAFGQQKKSDSKLDIAKYLSLTEGKEIYPNEAQLAMLQELLPTGAYQPAEPISDRNYWQQIAGTSFGKKTLEEALSFMEVQPEVPISDSIYRLANKEGNRGIYKPRYYRSMDRLEKLIVAECIQNRGEYLPQIEVYIRAIMEMKSWLHPNHDDAENSVLEGRRVAIDLGARKFGLVLALANSLLEDRLSTDLKTDIREQLEWRIIDSYLASCKEEDPISNSWIRSTSNWNSVCTSGSVFTTLVSAEKDEDRVAAVGCALNSMRYYLSGFGEDGYCSEGTGYWSYGFGHYLYLAELLSDYTGGKVDLFEFDNPEKLQRVANFPENYQLYPGLYAPFSDGVTRVKDDSDNFAYYMSAAHYGSNKPEKFIVDEVVEALIIWSDSSRYFSAEQEEIVLPEVTYFDDFGIVLSRGQQQVPFSIAIKAGHNAENHNHSDVGSYVITIGDGLISGDIGAPSYRAGAFSKDNPARSSWGHPVPKVNNSLQSNGANHFGRILSTNFTDEEDQVVMDLKPAYSVPGLTSLTRTMTNQKSGDGTIIISDHFSAEKPMDFGLAIMTLSDYELLNSRTVLLDNGDHRIKVEVLGEGISLHDELVPVEHLREGGPAYRIGVDLDKPASSATITIKFTPVFNELAESGSTGTR